VRTAWSCVIDAKPKFEWQGFLWIASLVRNGGVAPADLKVHCLPGVTEGFKKVAAKLGACVVETRPFEAGHVYCNKIEQCSSPAFEGYERIVLCDSDLFFLAAPELPEAPFAGKPVDLPNPPLGVLRRIYGEAGVTPSEEIPVDCALSPEERTIRSNMNGGLYRIDGSLLRELGAAWRKNALWLLERIDRLGSYKAHVDQVAMALALDQLRVPFALLTARENFPAHLPPERLRAFASGPVSVLHYHARVTPQGDLEPPGVPWVDEHVARANRDIKAIVESHVDMGLFWNQRYASCPELGSGVGSRGEHLQYKRALLARLVAPFREKSVLDVGCGDLETTRELRLARYTGRDASAEALAIARAKRPDWAFELGGFTEPALPEADLVICLDVLIHQKRREDYLDAVARLAEAARERLVVSGYDAAPTFVSAIVGFHEPLSETLGRLGVFAEIKPAGHYRDTTLFVADKTIRRSSWFRSILGWS
jgi:SAM-dependent methyltransferase